MSTSALQVKEAAPSIALVRRTADMIGAQRSAIVRLMEEVMKPGIDYGKVPGTPKPTLFKPGSEKLLSMFRLTVKPEVEDLSTPDTIRYRVRLTIADESGLFLGEGVGEASSAESKYQWRKAVCVEEWDATPEDRRRIKWQKGDRAPYSIQQVRTEMEDVANTVLKMAKKRAQIDGVLTVTAASDVFSQDAEDLKAAGIDSGDETVAEAVPAAQTQPAELPRKQPAAAAPASSPAQPHNSHPPQTPPPSATCGVVISEAQARRFYAIWKQAGKTAEQVKSYLGTTFGIDSDRDMLAKDYDKACSEVVQI